MGEYDKMDDAVLSVEIARRIRGPWCLCWFSLNTGPKGECEKCGKRLMHFASDLDACAEAEKKFKDHLWPAYMNALWMAFVNDPSVINEDEVKIRMVTATARERCVAMLEAVDQLDVQEAQP